MALADTATANLAQEKEYFDLDLLGQQPGLNLYTQLCFCFPLATGRSDAETVETLKTGIQRLSKYAPWATGEVMNQGAEPGNTGTFRIGKLGQDLQLSTKDYRDNQDITFAKLREASYPASQLSEALYASRMTFPDPMKPGVPVFEVQANFINGGLILTIVGHHQAMDMMGQAFLIKMFSQACGNQTISQGDADVLNTWRKDSIPLKDDSPDEPSQETEGLPGKSHTKVTEPTTTAPEVPVPVPKTPPSCSWAFFNFSALALKELKDEASASLTSGYISTDDALTALTWKSLSNARAKRLTAHTISKFGRAVDVRRYLGHSKTYPGIMQCMTHHVRTIDQLEKDSLGLIAAELRVAVDPTTTKLAEDTRALATKIAQAKDRSKLNFTGEFDPSTGLMLSSWAAVDCYNLEFGLGLGSPDMVRRPSFTNVEGLAYLMPKTPQGDIALMLCARDEDLDHLRVEKGFIKYATYVG